MGVWSRAEAAVRHVDPDHIDHRQQRLWHRVCRLEAPTRQHHLAGVNSSDSLDKSNPARCIGRMDQRSLQIGGQVEQLDLVLLREGCVVH